MLQQAQRFVTFFELRHFLFSSKFLTADAQWFPLSIPAPVSHFPFYLLPTQSPDADSFSGMLSMKPKWFAESRLHWSSSFFVDFFKDFPYLFFLFSSFFCCKASSHLHSRCDCPLTARPKRGAFIQRVFFPSLQWERVGSSWGPGVVYVNCCGEDREGAHLIRAVKRLSKDEIWKHAVVKSVQLNGGSKGTVM